MKSRMKDTLLLIGDADSDRARFHDIFESSFHLLEAENYTQGTMLLEQNSDCIAAVLVDIPEFHDEQLRRLAAASHPGTADEIPIIAVITPAHTGEREEYAFILGASDVVLKPYTTLSLQRRVQVLVDLYSHQWHLEKLVEDQDETIREANQAMLDTLSTIIEHRSTESGNHILRLRRFTQILLQEVARCCPEYNLNDHTIDIISGAAVLHDVGKISIPDSILNKPGKLTTEEYEIMKSHTTVGSELISQLKGLGDEMFMRYAYNISLYHHERWDGGGYPTGLKGDEIPICAQAVGLADAFDALTTPRVYKPAYPHNKAINMILNGECGQFSPKLLECFKRVRQNYSALAHKYADGYSPKSDAIQIPLPPPEKQVYSLDAVQLSRLKYQTLLHHHNDTVIEMDLDQKVYHVVYNPNPDFLTLLNNTSLDALSELLLHDGVHPDDAERMSECYHNMLRDLFQRNLRKHTLHCRLFSPPHGVYIPYDITVLRVNTDNPEQRFLLVVFHREQDGQVTIANEKVSQFLQSPPLFGMLNSVVRCSGDNALTVDQGGETLLPLTGYTLAEINASFGNSLLQMIAQEDRQVLQNCVRKAQLHHVQEAEFRLLQKNGHPLWVLAKLRAFINPDGSDCFYLTMTDISSCKAREQALEATVFRNQLFIEQSGVVVFEWDLQKDTFQCSDAMKRRFGYNVTSPDFRSILNGANHFHPDDLPLIRSKLSGLLAHKGNDTVEVRIANSEGRYLWSRIRAVSLSDETGRITQIAGTIYDINELKLAALSMKQQAERDSLTKLLNKASTQQVVSNYLDQKDPGKLAAMLILDLDNFKFVNDTYGHLYGDAVLTQTGSTLRSLFRSNDILGRIGGDEFLILLKDVPSREMVLDRCALLVNTFRDQLHRLMPDAPVSISVGCALAPVHGHTYSELFRHADEALYSAKHQGKCQYQVFDPRKSYDTLTDTASRTTRIDSDNQLTMTDDSLVRFVFQSLYESRDMDATIDELLSFLGSQFNVSRVYIFENNDDNTTCSNTFEWCNTGITPEKEMLQNISYITDIPGWPEVYNERGVLYCTDIADLHPTARAILEPQGIKSMLQCAIMDRGVFRGYVGFDECTSNRLWTQGQVSLLEFLAQVLAVFLLQHRASQKLTGAK